MERYYQGLWRILFLGLFIVGFLGAIASSALSEDRPEDQSKDDLVSMIKEIRLAQEVNDINANRWDQDVSNINEDGLSRVEALLSQQDPSFQTNANQ